VNKGAADHVQTDSLRHRLQHLPALREAVGVSSGRGDITDDRDPPMPDAVIAEAAGRHLHARGDAADARPAKTRTSAITAPEQDV